MSNHDNHRRGEKKRTEHGPRWENPNPGKGCNTTHVARSRAKWKKLQHRSLRRRGKVTKKFRKFKLGRPQTQDLVRAEVAAFAEGTAALPCPATIPEWDGSRAACILRSGHEDLHTDGCIGWSDPHLEQDVDQYARWRQAQAEAPQNNPRDERGDL